MEPKAVVTYVPPPPCEPWDLPIFYASVERPVDSFERASF